MTPILLLLAFLLMLDVLILLGPSTTRETAGTGSRAAYPRLARRPLRPSDDQTSSRLATESEIHQVGALGRGSRRKGRAAC
jgi:hypothetical protein